MRITPQKLRRFNFVLCSAITGAFAIIKEKNVKSIKQKLDSKTDDKVKHVPIQLKVLVDEIAKELKFEEFSVRPYITEDIHLKTITGCIFPKVVFLGIPQYFVFGKDDTQFSAVVNGEDIPKTAPEYQSLKECMCLSTEAKKFGIAQELVMAELDRFPLSVFLPVLVGILGFFLSVLMEITNMKAKRPSPVLNHGTLILSIAWFYCVANDISSIYREGKADLSAAQLGESYIKGGIEYYQKMIKINTFLKKINKNAPYTEEGDINTHLFRKCHMPIHTRVTYLTDISRGREIYLWKNIFS